MNAIQYLKEARQLYRSDSRSDTLVALLIVLVVLAPGLLKLRRLKNGGDGGD